MSFPFSQTSPSPTFASNQLHPLEDNNYWRPNRSPTTTPRLPGYGLSQQSTTFANTPNVSRLSPFFSNNNNNNARTLPMYKDKPYFAPRRTGPRSRRRKVAYSGMFFVVLACIWYYLVGDIVLGEIGVRTRDSGKEAELWEWVQGLDGEEERESKYKSGSVDWEARREKVRDAFIVSWDGYEKYGWGYDEYFPIKKKGKYMVPGGMGWIIVDALDTLMMMNLTSRVQHARNWIQNSLEYNQHHDVNTFETTIRMLGGLLSAHYISTQYPDLAPVSDDDAGSPGEDLYIEKATDLAERLLGAFDSPSGIPLSSINLNTSEGINSHQQHGASSTAEATTLQLEFKYLAKLTGEAEYWQMVERVMQVVDAQKMQDGLLPIYMYPQTGQFRGKSIRLGSRGDSYYEYLIKQYLQTSEPIYKDMWEESLMGIRKHLITYSKRGQLTVLAERPDGLQGPLVPKMDHLVCFLPGTIALGATSGRPLREAKNSPEWTRRQDEEMLLAQELMKTCWTTYLVTKTGLAPEIAYFVTDRPQKTMADMYPSGSKLEPVSEPLELDPKTQWGWPADIQIHKQDRHNLQRPETVESLFYLYRITEDETYREWGWEMFKSFMRHTSVVEYDDDDHHHHGGGRGRITGFTSLSNTNAIPPVVRDNMEGFWMSETLKYLYLLFSEREFMSLEGHVFNTEAHPFPRFRPTGKLKTGWAR